MLLEHNNIRSRLYIYTKHITFSSEKPYRSSSFIKQRLKNIINSISIERMVRPVFNRTRRSDSTLLYRNCVQSNRLFKETVIYRDWNEITSTFCKLFFKVFKKKRAFKG